MDQSDPGGGPAKRKEDKPSRPRTRAAKCGPNGANNTSNSASRPEPQATPRVNDLGAKKTRKKRLKKAKEPSNEKRFAEIAKLVRRYIPITVNGLAVSSILHPKPQEDANAAFHAPAKKLLKLEKLAIISAHIRRIADKNPELPLYLGFILVPSDPDFPFKLELLHFNLTIPAQYARSSTVLPSLLVLNTDIPRGYAVNIERMYSDITRLALGGSVDNPELVLVNGKGLLSQIQTLDRNLESALKQEMRATVKFVSFKRTPAPPIPPPSPKPTPQRPENPVQKHVAPSPAPLLKEAQKARSASIERMCAKLGAHVRLFHRSATEERYKVHVPVASTHLPRLWTFENDAVDVLLSIPEDFPENNPTVSIATNFSNNLMTAKRIKLEAQDLSLLGLVEEARGAEKNFRVDVSEYLKKQTFSTRSAPLFFVSLINWVTNNLEWLLKPREEYVGWETLMTKIR